MGSQPSRILVYGLLNPVNDELFYVGQTRKRREFRLLEHIEHAVGGSELPVRCYIRDLIGKGRIPSIFVLERVKDPTLTDGIERRWIRHFATNSHDSLPIKVTPQTPRSVEVCIRSVSLTNVRDMPRKRAESKMADR